MDLRRLTPEALFTKCQETVPGEPEHEQYKNELCNRRGGRAAKCQYEYLVRIRLDNNVKKALVNQPVSGATYQLAYCEAVADDEDMRNALLSHNPNMTYFELIRYCDRVKDRPEFRDKIVSSTMFLIHGYDVICGH